MGKTLRRYLLREIAGAFLAGVAIFSSILFLLKTVDLIELIFARGVPAPLVARLLAAILPSFLEATLPMAFLLGLVAALGRMAADRETMALRAAGLSLWQLLPTILGFGGAVSVLTLALAMTARPWGHQEIERTAFEIAKTRASAALRPRFFNTDFERMVVYVDHVDDASGDLVGVLLSDDRSSSERATVFAKRGHVGGHEDSGTLFLRLDDGTSVRSREDAADVDVTKFRSLEVRLDLRSATGNRPINDEPAALGWTELQSDIAGPDAARSREASIELWRRCAMATAAFALALLGAALGFQPVPSTRGRTVAFSLAAILGFHALLTFAISLARSAALSPPAAFWLPNGVLFAVAALLARRVARDRRILALPPRLRFRLAPGAAVGDGTA